MSVSVCACVRVCACTRGRVWVRARSVKETVCIANAVECAEFMTRQEIAAMCNKLCDVLAGF